MKKKLSFNQVFFPIWMLLALTVRLILSKKIFNGTNILFEILFIVVTILLYLLIIKLHNVVSSK